MFRDKNSISVDYYQLNMYMVISRETKIDYIFGHKTKLNTFKIIEIVHSIFCDHMEPTRINNIKTI